jgi:hypothetical protein
VTVLALISCVAASAAASDGCACDPGIPESLRDRSCSLCREAEKRPSDQRIFFLKDVNPRKPNRWLALPREHGAGPHHLHDLPPSERAALWTAAIAKARELWGDEWGLAYNGSEVRTQCHGHIHIGKLLKGIETNNFITVSGPAKIPAPPNQGLWVHPVGGKLHVHLGEQLTETTLLK